VKGAAENFFEKITFFQNRGKKDESENGGEA